MITTYHYRIKDSGHAHKILSRMSRSVNFVWNFCKQTQRDALRNRSSRLIKDKKSGLQISIPYFLTQFEMNNLVSGSSKELGLHSQTVQAVSEEYTTRRIQFKKLLRWRGKRSLPLIPFKSSGIQFDGNRVKYSKHEFKIWNSYKK